MTDLINRMMTATTTLEEDITLIGKFRKGAANETVATDSGTIPTLSKLVEEVRDSMGASSGTGATYCKNLVDFQVIEGVTLEGTQIHLRSIYRDLDMEGEGKLYTYSLTAITDGVSIPTTVGYLNRPLDGKVYAAEFGADGTEITKDSKALSDIFRMCRDFPDQIRTLSMGTKCSYFLGGIVRANCSNLDWNFNGSSITLFESAKVLWHPKALGFGNHKNVTINDGVWIGNVLEGEKFGNICMDIIKMDNMIVQRNTFIEATRKCHILDLAGSRHIHFIDNIVTGSCPTDRNFTEVVQYAVADVQGPASPIPTADRQYVADLLPCNDIYVRRNEFIPYDNPVTGIKSYPNRPFGDHNFTAARNIYFEDNYVEDVMWQDIYAGTVSHNNTLNIPVVDNGNINNNTFVSNNGNYNIMWLVGSDSYSKTSGVRPKYSICNNKIYVRNVAELVEAKSTNCIRFIYNGNGSMDTHGVEFDFMDNEVFYDITSSNEIPSSGDTLNMVLSDGKPHVRIHRNKFHIIGAGHAVRNSVVPQPHQHNISVRDNEFTGDSTKPMLSIIPSNWDREIVGDFVEIKDNVFHSVWKAMDVSTQGPMIVTGNIINGRKTHSFDGVDIGTDPTIYIRSSQPTVARGNILVNQWREGAVRVGSKVDAFDEAEFYFKDHGSAPPVI